MAGLRVGIVGAGGVGIATASALIMQGLAGRVTLYDRAGIRARGEALDYLHALPLLPSTEIRGRSYDEFEPDDVMIITCGHHIQPGETRLDVLDANVEILDHTASAMDAGGLPRVVIVVTNPLDVLTDLTHIIEELFAALSDAGDILRKGNANLLGIERLDEPF